MNGTLVALGFPMLIALVMPGFRSLAVVGVVCALIGLYGFTLVSSGGAGIEFGTLVLIPCAGLAAGIVLRATYLAWQSRKERQGRRH